MKTFTIFAVGCLVLAGQSPFACAQTPPPDSAVVAKARQLRLEGQATESIKVLQPVVQRSPDNYLARYNLGLAYANAGKQAEAIKELESAKRVKLRSNVKDGSIYNSLGWAYLQSGNYDSAIREFTLAKDPTVYSTLTPATRKKVENNLELAVAYQKVQTLQYESAAKP